MKVGIVGLGLIGGSIALKLKDLYDKIRTTDLINEMQEKVDSYRERKN